MDKFEKMLIIVMSIVLVFALVAMRQMKAEIADLKASKDDVPVANHEDRCEMMGSIYRNSPSICYEEFEMLAKIWGCPVEEW